MYTIRAVAIASLSLLLGLACEDVDSSDLLTTGMHADIAAVADGDGITKVTAVLRAGGPTSNVFVELDGDDSLMASLEGDERPMTQETLGSYHQYATTYDVDAAGTEFHVAFTRSIDDGAPDSSMTLPEAFELDPIEGDAFSRAEGLTVSWTPTSTGDMLITLAGGCVFDWDAEIDGDPGQFTFGPGEIELISEDAEESCETTIVVWRRLEGQIDPGYGEGGFARGIQARTVAVTSNP